MSLTPNWSELFLVDPATDRIIGLANNARIITIPTAPQMIALDLPLVHQQTKQPTGQNLVVQIPPAAAIALARLLRDHADKQGWPEMPETMKPSFSPPKPKH